MRFNFGKLIISLLCLFCLLLSVSFPVLAGPLSDDTEFVTQVYRDFLNREPDASGLSYWVDQLEGGTLDSAELVEQYMLSAEFGQTVAPVTRLYFAYFNRIPDFTGLMYWIDSYKQGSSLISISDAFAGSGEFTSTYGSLSNSDFVTLVYQNVLGRDPDHDGLDYWTDLLDSSTQTRGQVMVGFSESPEYQTLMANRIYVTMTYIGLLRRSPDQSGFDYWVNIIDQGATGLGLIDGFLYSTEYQGRFDGTWVINSLEISGPANVDENSSANYIATATWEDGRTSLVGASWSENSSYASISSTGGVTTTAVSADSGMMVSASFTSGGTTATDTHSVTIEDVPIVLTGLTISGPTNVDENSNAQYVATASWSDGSNTVVTPSWSENSNYSSISTSGFLSTTSISSDQSVTITASYTYGSSTQTDTHSVTINDIPSLPIVGYWRLTSLSGVGQITTCPGGINGWVVCGTEYVDFTDQGGSQDFDLEVTTDENGAPYSWVEFGKWRITDGKLNLQVQWEGPDYNNVDNVNYTLSWPISFVSNNQFQVTDIDEFNDTYTLTFTRQ